MERSGKLARIDHVTATLAFGMIMMMVVVVVVVVMVMMTMTCMRRARALNLPATVEADKLRGQKPRAD
jgi:heme/copper-type cytochrome/quinol oxidase subunit 2